MTLGEFRKITAGLEENTPLFYEVPDLFNPDSNVIWCADAVRIESQIDTGLSIVICETGDWGD